MRAVVAAYDVQGLAVVVARRRRRPGPSRTLELLGQRRPRPGRATRAARRASGPRRPSCPSARSRAARRPSRAPAAVGTQGSARPGCARRDQRQGELGAGEAGGGVGQRDHADVVQRVDEQARLEARHRAGVAGQHPAGVRRERACRGRSRSPAARAGASRAASRRRARRGGPGEERARSGPGRPTVLHSCPAGAIAPVSWAGSGVSVPARWCTLRPAGVRLLRGRTTCASSPAGRAAAPRTSDHQGRRAAGRPPRRAAPKPRLL